MLRKNTSGQNLGFKLVNASTGEALTGATVTVYRSIDGGAQAAATGTVSEKGNGQYSLALSSADTNGNQISFLFVATGAVLEEKTITTTTADPTDSQRFGLAALPASGSLSVKPAVTLNPADVSGNLPCDVQTIKTQAVTAASGVTFPASIGTSTYAGGDTTGTTTLLARVSANVALAGTAPSWWTAPDNTTLGYLSGLLTGDHTQFTATALALAPSGGGGPSAATIAAAVWDESKSAHSVAGSFGAYLDVAVSSRVASASAPGWYTAPPVTGLKLASDGLDSVAIETGLNARQALCLIAAAEAGLVSGADTNTPIFKGAGVATTRISATCDVSGNRTAVSLNPPA